MDSIAVWFSCGAASAVAAHLTIKEYGKTHKIRVVNNVVAEEDIDNRRFLEDVEKWLGVEIEIATNPKYPSNRCVDVWNKRKFMSGTFGAPCTVALKKEARQIWETKNPCEYLVLGFTAEEKDRAERFKLTERENLIAPLIDRGLTKQDCFDILRANKIELPRVYYQGYPNANCIGCVKATSPTYWNHVRQRHPDVFDERAKQSRKLNARLVRVNNERIFLDELDPFEQGAPMKSMDIDCGLFCEEGFFK